MDYPLPEKSEFINRWSAAQEEMERGGIDLLIAYSNDRALHGPGNVRYFSDFPSHFEDVSVLLAKKGAPVLLTGPECKEYAQLVSFIDDIRVIEEFAMPEEEYPFTRMTDLRTVVDELSEKTGKKIKKVGIAGMELISHVTFQRLSRALFSDVEVLDANHICFKLRSRKSGWETAVIQKGYELTGLALDRAIEQLKPGITEFEIAAEIEGLLRSRGSEGNAVDTIVAFGRKNTHPIVNRPGTNTLIKEDFGLLTFGPRIHGYNPSIGRPFFVGKGNENIKDIAKIALEAQMECERLLKPGEVGSDVEAVGRKKLARHKLDKYFVYAGIHSVGLAEFEPPILAPKSRDVIEPGMVFSIDIPIFLTPWGGLRFEDGFLITDEGNIHLSNYRREVIHL